MELVSALSRRVRMREISQDDAAAIVQSFQTDINSGFYTCITLEMIHYHCAIIPPAGYKPGANRKQSLRRQASSV